MVYPQSNKVMRLRINILFIGLFIALQIGCNSVNTDVKVTPVDTSLFIESNLLEEITTEDCELSNGLKTKCYKITMKAKVFVTLKRGVLDPQGKAIAGALGSLGFEGVAGVAHEGGAPGGPKALAARVQRKPNRRGESSRS